MTKRLPVSQRFRGFAITGRIMSHFDHPMHKAAALFTDTRSGRTSIFAWVSTMPDGRRYGKALHTKNQLIEILD